MTIILTHLVYIFARYLKRINIYSYTKILNITTIYSYINIFHNFTLLKICRYLNATHDCWIHGIEVEIEYLLIFSNLSDAEWLRVTALIRIKHEIIFLIGNTTEKHILDEKSSKNSHW